MTVSHHDQSRLHGRCHCGDIVFSTPTRLILPRQGGAIAACVGDAGRLWSAVLLTNSSLKKALNH